MVLQPGILQPKVLTSKGLTSRALTTRGPITWGFYNQMSQNQGFLCSEYQFDPTREHTQPLGAACLKPSARFALGLFSEKTKGYMTYQRKVIYNPSNIQLQRTKSEAN